MTILRKVSARAHANIALVKYWGKWDESLNIPATGSLSATLDDLTTTTDVTLDTDLNEDVVLIDGALARDRDRDRVTSLIDRFRALGNCKVCVKVDSHNNFPTAAGLASSASGFAALALALNAAFELKLHPRKISAFARIGSGSAARSIYGGFVEMRSPVAQVLLSPMRLTLKDLEDLHFDSYAVEFYPAAYWPLACTVALTATGEKEVSSSLGMRLTQQSSPYYRTWVRSVPDAIDKAKRAIEEKSFLHLAQIAEASALQMHACAMATQPGIIYWNGLTVEIIKLVRDLRDQGLFAFFTVDAGPHVKIFSPFSDQNDVVSALQKYIDSDSIITTKVGGEPVVEIL